MYAKFIGTLLFIQLIGLTCINASQAAPASDTLTITVKQAEDRFIKNNLSLIVQRYNIDNASAQVITARLFQNPDFSFANGIYASGVPNAYSEQTYGISQLFTTAGKRNKNIQLAKLGVFLWYHLPVELAFIY